MTKTIFKKWAFILLAVISSITISCSRATEEPPVPTNESNTLGHDRWSKVEFTIRKGHLHGVSFHGNIDGDDPYFKGVQKFSFEIDDTGNVVRKNEKGKVLAKGEEPILMAGHFNYAIEIVFYNKQGQRINNQFTTNDMLPIHQHFFTVKEYKDLNTGKIVKPTPKELMDYTYRDTNPENIMIGNFISGTTQVSRLTNNPLGLKGYITNKRGRVSYEMNVMLAHILKGNKFTNNGNAWPFNEPSPALLSVAVPDFSQSIPIVVVTTPTDGTEESFKKFIEEIAEYFNISVEEVKKRMNNGPVDESGAYWM